MCHCVIAVLLQNADGDILSWSANTQELNITAKARQCRNVLQERGLIYLKFLEQWSILIKNLFVCVSEGLS